MPVWILQVRIFSFFKNTSDLLYIRKWHSKFLKHKIKVQSTLEVYERRLIISEIGFMGHTDDYSLPYKT